MGDPNNPSEDDLARAKRIGQPIARFMARWRARIRKYPWLNVVYRAIITVLGSLIVIVGIIMIPLPGPGWLVVFIGLTVLGSEWHWARRLTTWVKLQLARFWRIWNMWRAERAEKRKVRVAEKAAKKAARLERRQALAARRSAARDKGRDPLAQTS